jgi:DNA-binding NarL/FixJ family response regulator
MSRQQDSLATLTPRELEVLALMAGGRTNAAIATALVIDLGAVEKNVTWIFAKLRLEDSGTDHRGYSRCSPGCSVRSRLFSEASP